MVQAGERAPMEEHPAVLEHGFPADWMLRRELVERERRDARMGDKCRSRRRAEHGASQHPPPCSGLGSSRRCVPGQRELAASGLRINIVMKKLESD